ncbi:dihydrodipicolinate reductase [Arboricoccus pini]|uniref:4-hydroxy-tetrahydrodipicolinate reductase n=1 Tax=Arboricoccus pini TaxID=1963835 RepID=A0A212QT68_9PROT|nr:4-hydroxy-tetrahydrodipicolinate reductase [Arboricoccus pini]SNB62829.1 dihydrodipicolinate reductase [Arboricoccus pini]
MRVGIIGCGGRMGRLLLAEVLDDERLQLGGGLVRKGSNLAGQDAGVAIGRAPVGVTLSVDPEIIFAQNDVVVDFSTPGASLEHATIAAARGKPLVIGTTGIPAHEEVAIRQEAERTAIVLAANTSVGVILLAELVQRVAAVLDDDFDIEIVEMHHRRKVDAPSGTALLLGDAAAKGRGVDLQTSSVRARDGHTGARIAGAIGFAALRGGDVVGDHSVYFAGDGERLVLSHLASDRRIYAKGAIRAARWLIDRSAGFYTMRDVLGFSDD